jgi:hypothetical protein
MYCLQRAVATIVRRNISSAEHDDTRYSGERYVYPTPAAYYLPLCAKCDTCPPLTSQHVDHRTNVALRATSREFDVEQTKVMRCVVLYAADTQRSAVCCPRRVRAQARSVIVAHCNTLVHDMLTSTPFGLACTRGMCKEHRWCRVTPASRRQPLRSELAAVLTLWRRFWLHHLRRSATMSHAAALRAWAFMF